MASRLTSKQEHTLDSDRSNRYCVVARICHRRLRDLYPNRCRRCRAVSYLLESLRGRIETAETFREKSFTPAFVNTIPPRPNFVLTDFQQPMPRVSNRTNADSVEAANFRLALKDAFNVHQTLPPVPPRAQPYHYRFDSRRQTQGSAQSCNRNSEARGVCAENSSENKRLVPVTANDARHSDGPSGFYSTDVSDRCETFLLSSCVRISS